MKKNTLLILIFAVIILVLVPAVYYINVADQKKQVTKKKYIQNQGNTQGTTYSIIYEQPDGIDLHSKITERLHQFDLSLSTYDSTSIISRINRNDPTVTTDEDFEIMYKVAEQVSNQTQGAFDITVGKLVKAWGFASENSNHKKIPNVKSLLQFIGYEKIKLENHKLIKNNPEICIDANALAQGQSADIIANLLKNNGCTNYMVEIGGEIVCKGLNSKSEKWRIGIEKPINDSTNVSSELQTVISITNTALTTSGNYRKFYYLNGKKYNHEINPHTGYPVNHNLLSATVVAPTCIVADAYATAFMVMGLEASLKLCDRIPGLEGYFIYAGKDGKNSVVYTKGFKQYLTK